jgi:hypothetical protein
MKPASPAIPGSKRGSYVRHIRRGLLALALLSGCGDAGGPGAGGRLFTSVTRDGLPWTPDTAFAILPSGAGGIATITLSRSPVPGTPALEPLSIILESLAGTGTYQLTGGLGPNQGYYPVLDSLGQLGLIYSTQSFDPGQIVITGYDPTDSTIAGTFSFTVYGQTDTTRHYAFAGQFRLRDAY